MRKRSRDREGNEGAGSDDQVIGSFGDENEGKVRSGVSLDIAITPAEAHAKLGKGSKDVSYEDLYGAPAPKMEDGMTARELKDYISGQIEDLERMESMEE